MYIVFLLLWIVFNGSFTLEILLIGMVIAALVFAFVCRFMDYSLKKEKAFYRKIIKMVCYAFVLVVEIVKANFATIHMILSYKEEIDPVLVRFKTDLKTEEGRAFLANSITLTPGTITVNLEGDEFLVHALDSDFAVGMDTSEFAKRIGDIEGGKQ